MVLVAASLTLVAVSLAVSVFVLRGLRRNARAMEEIERVLAQWR